MLFDYKVSACKLLIRPVDVPNPVLLEFKVLVLALALDLLLMTRACSTFSAPFKSLCPLIAAPACTGSCCCASADSSPSHLCVQLSASGPLVALMYVLACAGYRCWAPAGSHVCSCMCRSMQLGPC